MAVVENVPGLRTRGLADVLDDLTDLGYDASWQTVGACEVGARHRRDRIFLVAWRRELGPPAVAPESPAALWPPDPAPRPPRTIYDLPDRAARLRLLGNAVVPQQAVAAIRRVIYQAPSQLVGSPIPAAPPAGGILTAGRVFDVPRSHRHRLDDPGLWPTPKASESGPDYARVNRPRSGGDDLHTRVARNDPGPLNPEWVEWLMGYPLNWTALTTPTKGAPR